MNANIRRICCVILLSVFVGCSINPVDLPGDLMGKAKQMVGLGESGPVKRDPKEIIVSVRGMSDLNSLSGKNGLALVLRAYALKDNVAFFQIGKDVFESPSASQALVEQGVVNIKEVVVIPAQKVIITEKVDPAVSHIGLAGFFRDPSSTRWRLVIPVALFKSGKPIEVLADRNGLCVVPVTEVEKSNKDASYCRGI